MDRTDSEFEPLGNFVSDAYEIKRNVTFGSSNFTPYRRPIYGDGIEIPLEQSSRLLLRFLQAEGFDASDIEEYNRFLDLAQECISSKWIKLPNDERGERYATFGNLQIDVPKYQIDKVFYYKTPQMCRLKGETYDSTWRVTVTIRRGSPTGELIENPFVIDIGNVPIMLRSRYCVLRDKTPEELQVLGEDPNDMFGYFIVKGAEKVILKQEKLVVNRFLLFSPSKSSPTIRITAKTIRGTIVVEMNQNKNGIVKMTFPSLRTSTGDKNKDKAKALNVVRILRILGRLHAKYSPSNDGVIPYQSIDSIEELLSYFVYPDHRRACLNKLATTFDNSFKNSEDDEYQMLSKIKDRMIMSSLTSKEIIDEIELIFENDLFNHLSEIPNHEETPAGRKAFLCQHRIYLFAFMLGRYLEFLAGFRPLDSNDSWSNKRAVGGGCMMEQLFRTNWYKILSDNSFQTKILRQGSSTEENKLKVTETFRTSFTTPNWGVKGRTMKNNVAQTLGRTSVLETFSHLSTIDVPVSRKNVPNSIRLVQQSQWNVICPVNTSEGDNCGLVKNKSVTVKLSLERRDVDLLEVLLGYSGIDGVPPTEYVRLIPDRSAIQVLINGKFIGWEVPSDTPLQSRLIRWRRRHYLALDVSIILIENVLYVDMSPSRPIFPYLVVDSKSQELVIDRLNLRDSPIEKMFEKGAIEYISAWEQEYVKVAPYQSDIEERKRKIQEATSNLQKAEAEIARLEKLPDGLYEVPVQRIRQDLIKELEAKLALGPDPEIENLLDEIKNTPGKSVQYQVKRTKKDLLRDALNYYASAKEEFEETSRIEPYDYCHIDPITFVGILACAIPYMNHNQAPRNTYQSAMSKQVIGIPHINYLKRNSDGKSKAMIHPTRPLVETEIAQAIGLTNRNAGNNIVVAFMSAPNTEEDAFIIKKEFLDNGGFRSHKYLIYKQDFESTTSITQKLCMPAVKSDEPADRYRFIGENGLPYLGAYLKQGDCIIGKVHSRQIDAVGIDFGPGARKRQNRQAEVSNESVCLKIGDEGIVEDIHVYQTTAKIRVIVKLRMMHQPDKGDKLSPRNAQKGTIGHIYRASELPYTKDGVIPDLIVNPSCIPSRMTLSYPFELLDAKIGALVGVRKNGTAFRQELGLKGLNLEEAMKVLSRYNNTPNYEYGEEEVYSGLTGRKMDNTILIAPVYMSALKHQAMAKNQCRGEGRVKPVTRQPPKNKSNQGGIRFGEMERDAACGFGASSFVLERLCLTSDAYTPVFCLSCGCFGENSLKGGYYCPLCRNKTDFGTFTIPYAYKVLEHLMGAAGIRLRIKFTTFEALKEKIYQGQEVKSLTTEDIVELVNQEFEDAQFNDLDDFNELNDDAAAEIDYN